MYLSKIKIKNFRGIKDLEINFDPKINIIVGENGCYKSTLIDAIRLLYNLGKQQKEIFFTAGDFCIGTIQVEICYEFKDLSDDQKGALYEYLVITDTEQEFARITLIYKYEKNKVIFSYFIGENEGQRTDSKTFEIFQHYFLGALRDSTRDLLLSKNNILGNLINRLITKNESSETLKSIISDTNSKLLGLNEVSKARDSINENLINIYQNYSNDKVGLRIDESKNENAIYIIKPYLPFDNKTLIGDGLNLNLNSLGFNNLIYIATILGDIKQRISENPIEHYALLIEEPEAHLHPQLQLSLYNFLCQTNTSKNSQLFITTHSPTLTSKVPLENLIFLHKDNFVIKIGDCFINRSDENLEVNGEKQDDDKYAIKKKQLERYLDVTKSQLFFSKSILIVEGISEELLIPAFSQVLGFKLEEYGIELVNIDGISFYPILSLFNSSNITKRLPMRVALLTDDDKFVKSNQYTFNHIIKNKETLEILNKGIIDSPQSVRLKYLNQFIESNSEKIHIEYATKTLELELAFSNIPQDKSGFENNFLLKFLSSYSQTKRKFKHFNKYLSELEGENITEDEKRRISTFIWKLFNNKAEFAQDFSIYVINNLEDAKKSLVIPDYIKDGLEFLKENSNEN